jgi:hypothetical protein
VGAASPATTQIEVDFLLGYLAVSGCEFYRNGTWYDSDAAQAHLRKKYTYLVKLNMVKTADDFIEKAGSASSLSGEAYQVRCDGRATVPSEKWLTDELAHFRSRQ